jgi:hypothetical protein
MMMYTVAVIATVVVAIAFVTAAFRLESRVHLYKLRSEALKHSFDYMVGPNAKDLAANFGRQVPISEVPGKPDELVGFSMPDFD